MSKRILITGGAGFIGSHLADKLLAHGYRVRVLDNLDPQVHGVNQQRPAYLSREVELMVGDVRDAQAVNQALQGIDAVYHFAAVVGVGQSMYALETYTSINMLGTTTLLEALIAHPVERLIVASSMSIYGEGRYRTADGAIWDNIERPAEAHRSGSWELYTDDGRALTPIPTSESKPPALASIYALSKYSQEQMAMMIGHTYHIPTVALRFFNVFGPRQALSNPYTGVLAIFAARLLNGKPPLVYEDGNQQRDFVNVHDVARACRLALETAPAAGQVFNIGSGCRYTIREIAERMAGVLGREDLLPQITGTYRRGDIRHCFADITLAQQILGYTPQVSFEQGLREMAAWLDGQIAHDRCAEASAELSARGLTV